MALLEKPNIKKMALVRDLRDVTVSLAYYLDQVGGRQKVAGDGAGQDPYYSLATFEERLNLILTPNNTHNTYLVRNCEECLKALQNPEILVVRFEDLVGSRGGGSDQAQQEAILKIVDFMGMRLSDAALGKIQENLFGSTTTFRKGQIGSWREEFSDQNNFLFEQTFGRFNRAFGYR